MKSVPVAIVGGGLSGLYAALLLQRKGIDYILLEARPTLGGRIVTTQSQQQTPTELLTAEHSDSNAAELALINSTDSFDLGPSWFWPDFQQQLGSLIEELQLPSFA